MLSELENYLLRIEDLRGQILSLIADLPAEALNWRPTDAGDDHVTNSLAAMAAHVAGAEHFWIGEVIGGRTRTRDREAELAVEVEDAVGLGKRLAEIGEQTRRVFAELSDSDLGDTRTRDERTITVRWGILHVVDHTALHLGHMQITYQLWRGGKGIQAPRWYQRLPAE